MIAKILYIITQSEFGGAQRSVLDLAVGMQKKQYDVVVAAGQGRGDFFEMLERERIRTVSLRCIQRGINPVFDLLGIIELYRLLRKEKPDIVHLNSTKVGILGSIAASVSKLFFGNPKIVFTAHGWVFNEEVPYWKKLFYRYAEKVASFLRDKIICVSQFDYEAAVRYTTAPAGKLALIHNGIDAEAMRFFSREDARRRLHLALEPSTIIIGTVAHLYHNKGIDLLIHAVATVGRERPRVVVIGEGPERLVFERLITRLHLEHTCFFVGSIPDARRYLKAFDVFVLPSRKEGFPYALLEAGVAGLPIIATDAGGIPEIITHRVSGIVVPCNNVEALAAGIQELIGNEPLRKSMGIRFQQRVQEHFRVGDMVAHTSAVYDSLRSVR